MDELEIKGKKYISSKRASELTGYAKDYVGQLARGAKIPGTRMGRAWYVEEDALLAYKKTDTAVLESAEEGEPVSKSLISPIQKSSLSPATFQALGYLPKPFPSTWQPVVYSIDDSDLIPTPTRSSGLDEAVIMPQKAFETPMEPFETAIRIKILEARTQHTPRERPTVSHVTQKSKHIKRKRTKNRASLALGALTAALAVCLFFVSGFFFSSHIAIQGENGRYTANIIGGFQQVQDILKEYPGVQDGVNSLQGFFNAITGSFSDFFLKGMNFIASLFQSAFGR